MRRPEFLLLLGALAFAPLAFAAVEPWSRAVAETAVLAALAIALGRRAGGGSVWLREVPGALPLALLLGFLLLQLLPLPPLLVRLLSPRAHAIWLESLGIAGPLPWIPLSLDPLASLGELLRLCAAAAVYLLTVLVLTRRERLRATATALAAFAAVLAFLALLQALLAPNRLLFLRAAPPSHPFGPYVNRNHFANLMAMLTPVLLGLFLARGGTAQAPNLRRRLADLVARREASLRALLGLAVVLAATALVASLSRGATVAVAAALLTLLGLLLHRRLLRRGALAGLLLAGAFALFAGWFGPDRLLERFARAGASPTVVDSFRAAAWRDTLRMAKDFPVTGAGLGSFERLYPRYRTFAGEEALAHAHQDWLELLAGGGAIALGLLLWFVLAALAAALRLSRERRDAPALGLAFGAVAGAVAFLVHGLSDFSFSIEANALVFFFLLGLAVSAAATLRQEEGRSLLPRRRAPAGLAHGAAAIAVAAAAFHGGTLTADLAWRAAKEEILRAEALRVPPAGAQRLLTLASRAQPLAAAYPAALARVSARRGDLDEAVARTRAALRRLPADSATLAQLGALLGARGDDAGARRAFEAAVATDPSFVPSREAFGAWLLSRGDVASAMPQLGAALERDPERTPAVIALLVLAGLDEERIAAVLPRRPEVLLRLARYQEATGSPERAAASYRATLAVKPGHGHARAALRRLGLRD